MQFEENETHVGGAPPTSYEPILDERPSSWPTVIGTISIVLGALGLICYGCGTVQPMTSGLFATEEQRAHMPQGFQLALQVGQACAAWLLALLLLIGGIGLTRRRAWSPRVCVVWSILRLCLVLIATIAGVVYLPLSVEQINQQMTAQAQGGPVPFTVTEPMVIAMIIAGLIWGITWPTFILIWFSRRKIKDEVASWSAEARARI